jgi:ParB-like chromosome segregation protein Spo0J
MAGSTTEQQPRYLSPTEVMATFSPGDEWTWWQEAHYLWTTQTAQMKLLAADIKANGIKEPIVTGDDGRLWDGHHRLVIAAGLGLESIPAFWPENIWGEDD